MSLAITDIYSNNTSCQLGELPDEMLNLIFSFLDVKEGGNLAQTCQFFSKKNIYQHVKCTQDLSCPEKQISTIKGLLSRNSSPKIINFLLSCKYLKTSGLDLLFQAAVAQNHFETITNIFETRLELFPHEFDSLLINASMKRNITLVKIILEDKRKRANPAARNNTAIIEASKKGFADIVQLLLQDPRVDPSAQRNTAIVAASTWGHVDVVKLLLQDPRVDPSANCNAPLIFAELHCHKGVIEVLKAVKKPVEVK